MQKKTECKSCGVNTQTFSKKEGVCGFNFRVNLTEEQILYAVVMDNVMQCLEYSIVVACNLEKKTLQPQKRRPCISPDRVFT